MFAIKLFIGYTNNEILETVRKTIGAFECFKNSLHTRFAHKYLISLHIFVMFMHLYFDKKKKK